MGISKKVISVALIFVLFFTGIPFSDFSFGGIPYVYASESTPTVDIGYDDFTETENLQLNGDSLIENNAIRFENSGDSGESVFTKDKLVLGESLSFSTAFSFKNISPPTPGEGTKGGFTFTLQSVDNSTTVSDFQDESINPSLSIAFTADYWKGGATTRIFEPTKNTQFQLASLRVVSLAGEPPTLCALSVVPYISGDYSSPINQWEIATYNTVDESDGLYHVWLGYDGEEGILKVLCKDPLGSYTFYNTDYFNLADKIPDQVYAGFMGSLGNAGNTSEISSWYFKNDLSILNEALAEADEDWLNSEMEVVEANPVENLYLPFVGQYGSTISWISSNRDVVAEDGTVNPPLVGEENEIVTLTATIQKGSAVRSTRVFTVTVKARDADIVAADYDWLTETLVLNGNDALNKIVSDLKLPRAGQYGSTISWFSTDTATVNGDGKVTRPVYSEGDKQVTLTASINMNWVTEEKSFNVTVKALGISDGEIVDADHLWLTDARILNENSSLNKVSKNLSLPASGQYGSTIQWESSDEEVVALDGTVTIPALGEDAQTVTLTAIIRKGEAVREKEFTLIIKASDEDMVSADVAWLTDALILNGNNALNHVVSNLYLPATGNYGSTINWVSSDASVVSPNGIVTRPILGRGNEEILLRATVFGGDSMPVTVSFTVIVRAIGLSDQEMLSDDKSLLTDDKIKKSNSSLSIVISDLYLPIKGEKYGSTISWESSDARLVGTSGTVTRPSLVEGDKTVNLTATIHMGTAVPESKTFIVTIKALERTDEEKMHADYEWLEAVVILNGNLALNNITGSLFLPTIGNSGSNISWISTEPSIVSTSGTVTRPPLVAGDKTVNLTATINMGTAAPETKTFIVTVKALERTDEEKVHADYEWLEAAVILNGNLALNDIIGDLFLPTVGNSGSNISWISTEPSIVSIPGTVTRPGVGQNDQTVTITATISMNDVIPITKIFTVIVKAVRDPDADTVNEDFELLTDTAILNGNSALSYVTGNLSLPPIGKNGSNISWTSTDTSALDINGTVKRPTYTQGSKAVTLTATISKGLAIKEKTFEIIVVANPMTDEEQVAMDYDWLTAERILNGNSSLDNVMWNLYFPTTGMPGPVGSIRSHISWASNSHGFVTIGGDVWRPMFHVGDQTVTLTATISKGAVLREKTFTVIVKCLDLTGKESVDEAAKWLKRYNILGENLSASSVVKNLSWPLSGPYDAIITWHSDNTDVISNEGVVTRPENKRGNRRVNVTATVSKGGEQVILPFQYIVLEEPDSSAPVVTAAIPENNSTGVLWDTDKITITYNEYIGLDRGLAIAIEASEETQLNAYAEKNKLIITPLSDFSSGENRLIVPKGAVKDASGNPADAFELRFTVEEKLVKKIEVISSSPYDTEKDVAINLDRITIKFDSGNLVKGKYFDTNFTLRTVGKSFFESEFISLPGTLSNDTLTIILNKTLTPATVYEIIINEGDVLDRFLNKNSAKIIQFRTAGSSAPKEIIPKIVDIYPANGQTDVSVNPNIEITLSDARQIKSYPKLTDAFGTEYPLYAPYTLEIGGSKLLVFKPRGSLAPDMTYTLSGPYSSIDDPESKNFSTQFSTGSGLRITRTTPATGEWKASTRGIVEIYFDTPVVKGFNFEGIVFEDYFGDPVEFVSEEIGNKVVLKSLSELYLNLPHSVYLPYGAYQNTAGKVNDQNRITFYTTQDKLPDSLGAEHLNIPDVGFVGKAVRVSIDDDEMTSWVNYVRALGYGPVSYEWYIDGNLANTDKLFYRTFSRSGEYVIKLIVKDKYGFSYSTEKKIEIQDLQDIRMILKDSGKIMKINTWEAVVYPTLNFELRLEQDSRFIYGERIWVKLYKDGVLQPLTNIGDGGVTITSNYGDNAYVYAYKPAEGHSGTYELVFTYNGISGEQTIRQPFIVSSKKPATIDTFRFRMYNDQSATYFEALNYVYVTLNGERLKADKEMYTINGSTFPVYTLRKTLLTDTYYELNIEDWWYSWQNRPFYLGKDTATPTILTGRIKSVSTGMEVKSVTINDSESELNEDNNTLYFEGLSTKLVFDIEGEWGGTDVGYYEIASLRFAKGITSFKDTDYKPILVQPHDSKKTVQKITVRPGMQLKDESENYLIRMVSAQGYKSSWKLCPNVDVLPVPSILGKKLHVSVQDMEYAVDWPTVFDGPIGGTISFLDGIPVIGGGNFGLGGGMPNFEGGLDGGDVWLTFDAQGGYGEKSKTTQKTKYKKLKKVSVVGYTFEMELEGGINLAYNWNVGEWSTRSMYIIIDGMGGKYWDHGYEFLGVGFTAGVGIGADVFGFLQVKSGDEIDYSGIVRISPNANLHVNGDFKVASVKGSLSAQIPAEIHFPTGYIGADISVDAFIGAKALLWEKTLYKKTLLKQHWDNGKEKVTLLALENPLEETGSENDSEVQLMPRDYLRRQAIWAGGNDGSSRRFSIMETKPESEPGITDIMENIFPEAEIALIVSGEQQYLIWTDDNPLRDEVNRTQLRFTNFKDGAWSVPEWVYNDGTADFTPTVAASGSGFLMAWHNISRALSEDEGLADMLKSSEISVTESVYTTDGTSPGIINLTDDDKIDHSPRLAADGDKALLVWTKSEDMSLDFAGEESSSSLPGDQLFFSLWNNDTWSAPEAIGMGYSTVLDTSLAMKGEEALLLYTLDMDNDFSTGGDREIFARHYDGNAWGDGIQITDNVVNDSAPEAVWVDGKWLITWLEDGKISYKQGLDGETRTEEWLGNIQSGYRLIATEGDRPLAALVYTQPGEKMSLGIYASFYDFNNDKWSHKTGLVTEDIYAKAISAYFGEEGELNGAFTQADIITEAKPQIIDGIEEFVESESISDKVSLKFLTYTPVRDLALLKEDGITLSTEFPLPGAVTTAYVIVGNEGDFAEKAIVSLYDGGPEKGGVKIAETAPWLIPGRSSMEVEIKWLVGPEEKNQYDLYAVVRPSDGVREISTENNTVSLKISTSDIAIAALTCENMAADDYLINVTIVNRGSSLLEGAKVWLEDEADGEVIMTASLETLELGEEAVLTYMIQSKGRKSIRMRVTLPDGINEDNTDNNTRRCILEPLPFVVKSLNVAPGEEQVDVSSAISLDFNINIGQGPGFDQIRLMDEELNEVAISKVIENSKLTIRPLELLDYGTGYYLTIPADALGDSYGHTLREVIKLGFTTVTTNPEIISAYPGEFMENAALDTKIRLRFNQDVLKGYEFSKIALYEHVDGFEAMMVPVSASIEGELLAINYMGSLRKNATYRLEVPREAVENSRGETLQEDYLTAFNTGETGEAGEPGQGNDEDDYRQSSSNSTNEYKANISLGGTEKTLVVVTKASTAVIKLENLAREIFTGSQQAVLNISHIPGVNSHTLEMPAEAIASSGTALLTVNTALGSISIPSGMLSAMKESIGKTVGITIAAGDMSKLPADVKVASANRPVLQLTLTLDGVVTAWDNPDTPVMVSIPYTPMTAELESPESIVIWYIDGKGNVATIPNGSYNALTGRVSFAITHFSTFAVVYNKVIFKDVPDSAWYYRAVNFNAARGITLGTGNGNFSPDNLLTRGQFLTMMMKAYGIEQDADAKDNFSDAGDTWYTGYLAAAKHLAITKGTGDNLFKPDSEITRQEMFTLLYNTLKLVDQLPIGKSEKALVDFSDAVQITPWAKEAMILFVQTGILKGDSGKLNPEAIGNRAQMAQVIYNLLIR